MLESFLIRKATKDRIRRILIQENFSFTDLDVENLIKGNQKGVRYGNGVFLRQEGNVGIRRFLKIVLDGRRETYKLFSRQVKIASSIHKDVQYKSPTIAVIKESLHPPVPYAIFETREDGDGYGFMHDRPSFYEEFDAQEVRRLVDVMYSFHLSGFHASVDTLRSAHSMPSSLCHYKREFKGFLEKKIVHKKADGTMLEGKVADIVASYAGKEVRKAILRTLEENWSFVLASRAKDGMYLVHADMQIDNVYKHKDGAFELLDFEWVGKSDNPVIAIIYDYGNLRARAWSSPGFQAMLDTAMYDAGKERYGDLDMMKAALQLGLLRSSLLMTRYHLDFANTVKKDKRTEEDYFNMFPKTLSALIKALH
jgi:hypothetical protein